MKYNYPENRITLVLFFVFFLPGSLFTQEALTPQRYWTTANLRVRETPSTDSPIIATLNSGTEVRVLEIGPPSEIGSMTAPWVRVSSANGYTGWVFSGYLQAIQEMAVTVWQEIASENPPGTAYQAAVIVQSTPGIHSLPLAALIAIIGGTAIAASIIILSLTAKRKRYGRRKRKPAFYLR